MLQFYFRWSGLGGASLLILADVFLVRKQLSLYNIVYTGQVALAPSFLRVFLSKEVTLPIHLRSGHKRKGSNLFCSSSWIGEHMYSPSLSLLTLSCSLPTLHRYI